MRPVAIGPVQKVKDRDWTRLVKVREAQQQSFVAAAVVLAVVVAVAAAVVVAAAAVVGLVAVAGQHSDQGI